MKKTLEKFSYLPSKKNNTHKEASKKNKFSNYKEDFVMTEQEEKEGGFWGLFQFKNSLRLKIN